MVSIKSVKIHVTEYFREKAEYRRSLAEEKPESSGKNDSYAISIDRVCAYVEGLLEDDSTLKLLAEHPALYMKDGFWMRPREPDGGGAECFYDIHASHCGPRGEPIDPADCPEWFAEWV